MMVIRNETAGDYTAVETLTRRAFYNIYIPGCVEHYLVHCMRGHADFLPELDFVLELDGQVIGNIMYTKAKLVGESGMEKDIAQHRAGVSAERLWDAADGAFVRACGRPWV